MCSSKAHNQDDDEGEQLTCYAHAASTAIRAARAYAGLNMPDRPELLNEIIDEYGTDGAETVDVLRDFASRHYLKVKGNMTEAEAMKQMDKGRCIVGDFYLFDAQWDRFFDQANAGYVYNVGRRKKGDGQFGHAVVIVGQTTKKNPDGEEEEVWAIKNSWGKEVGFGGFQWVTKKIFEPNAYHCVYHHKLANPKQGFAERISKTSYAQAATSAIRAGQMYAGKTLDDRRGLLYNIIDKYGYSGGDVLSVLQDLVPEFDLKVKSGMKEEEVVSQLKKGRLVVGTFSLSESQWKRWVEKADQEGWVDGVGRGKTHEEVFSGAVIIRDEDTKGDEEVWIVGNTFAKGCGLPNFQFISKHRIDDFHCVYDGKLSDRKVQA